MTIFYRLALALALFLAALGPALAGIPVGSTVTTNTAQTISGVKTFSAAPVFSTTTAASVLFAGASGALANDNTNLRWDDANNWLGVRGTPATACDVVGMVRATNNTTPASGTGIEMAYSTGSSYGFINSYDRAAGAYKETRIDGNPVKLLCSGTARVTTSATGATIGGTLTATAINVGTGTTVNKIISSTAALDFPNTLAQTSSDLTLTVTGAATGDVVSIGVPNGSVLADSDFSAWVSAANTITIRFLNAGLIAKDPASGTFRAMVVQF